MIVGVVFIREPYWTKVIPLLNLPALSADDFTVVTGCTKPRHLIKEPV
jgi:hypothetical protein